MRHNKNTAHRITANKKTNAYLPAVYAIFSIALLALSFTRVLENRPEEQKYSRSGKLGAIASENPICSKIGGQILEKRGSAVDAAIATAFCIGTINMYSSGIGGGGFMLISMNKTKIVIDFREEAPAKSNRDMFLHDPLLAQVGGLAVAVPGELKGLETAHRLYGTLDWATLVEPSIILARDGWTVDIFLEKKINSSAIFVLADPSFRRVFAPKGRLLVAGDKIQRLSYAETLKVIANEGAHVFYTGWIAKKLISTINRAGGIMTLLDFENYEAKLREPMHSEYRGHTIITTPPPSSGSALLSILNILGNLPKLTNYPADIQFLVESFKHAYAQRAYNGDPNDPVFSNITSIINEFNDIAVAKYIFGRIKSVKGHLL